MAEMERLIKKLKSERSPSSFINSKQQEEEKKEENSHLPLSDHQSIFSQKIQDLSISILINIYDCSC